MPDFSAIRPYSNNSLKVDTYFDSYDDEPIAYCTHDGITGTLTLNEDIEDQAKGAGIRLN